MRASSLHPALCILLATACVAPAGPGSIAPADQGSQGSFAELLEGAALEPGLFPTAIDTDRARVWIELPAAGPEGILAECLYVEGLASGLGSNPVGLDRGQPGGAVVLRLRRIGEQVHFEVPNLAFRATGSAAEAAAVEESFAQGLLHTAPVAAEEEDRILVELTSFLARDAHGSIATLKRSGQGGFRLDGEASTVLPDRCHAFPDNLELEARLVLRSDAPGGEVRGTAATPEAVVLVQHHSLLRLPEAGYEPLEFDPRGGSFQVSYADYSSPLGEPLQQHRATRHRLEFGADGSIVEPIVYYLDPATPEPIRSALLDGARWWAEAFEAAGLRGAYRVEVLPEGVHPLDARFNVIEWVHRQTRGWSYGNSIVDPRTGEIVKGHVLLGSLRVRQDIMLFEGILGAAGTGSGGPEDPVQLALARLRQLAAHEVGHTLGFAHNFAASSAGRASVMDYPAPWITHRAGGGPDVSKAYAVGMGAWDLQAVRWLYGAEEGRAMALDGSTLPWATDQDARGLGTALASASLWDNGDDPVRALEDLLLVRRQALMGFGPHRIAEGEPLSKLTQVYVPLHLHHRYQLEAAVKLIGGLEYAHELRGPGAQGVAPVPAATQRLALGAVSQALSRQEITVPVQALPWLVPAAPGVGPRRELFEGRVGTGFDPVAVAETTADLALAALLHPQRAERLAAQAALDPGQLTLEEVILEIALAIPSGQDPVARAVLERLIARLELLAARPSSSAAVRAIAEGALVDFTRSLGASNEHPALLRRIGRFLARPAATAVEQERAPEAPPGPPIGSARHGFGTACGCGVLEDAPW